MRQMNKKDKKEHECQMKRGKWMNQMNKKDKKKYKCQIKREMDESDE